MKILFTVLGVIVFIALLLVCILSFFPIVQVVGTSMYPTYKNGEFLVGNRFFPRSKIKNGDVIIFHSLDKIVIKRVSNIISDGKGKRLYWCLGDNTNNSYDSRHYGFIEEDLIIARITNRYQRKKVL